MSEHTVDGDLLRTFGFESGRAPAPVVGQCTLLRAATAADAVVLTLAGQDEPAAVVGDADASGEATAVELRTSTGVVLGRLAVHAAGPVATALVEEAARAVVALGELEEARDRLFDAEESVARAEDSLAKACGQVVHDLNNPLAAVAMCLEIAGEQVGDELVSSLLQRAAGSAERMKRMVATLDEYGRRPVAGTTDLAVEVPALLADFAPLLDEAVEVVGDLPTVALSPGDVRTVLVALLDNAVKFRRDDVDLHVTVAAERVDDGWRVSVTDNGRGIEAGDLERVFAPTVRLDKKVPGLGLGLATVRRAVTAAGGRVGADSTPGSGTTVWFEVPGAGPSQHR